MAIQQKTNPFAIIPDLPRAPLVDKEGYITDQWRLFFDQFVTALQYYIKPESLALPQQTAANIALFKAQQFISNIVYDTTNGAFDGNIANTTTNAQTWVQFMALTTHAGNPNTFVAGNLYEFCWDTMNSVLYICTIAGNAAGATWTSV